LLRLTATAFELLLLDGLEVAIRFRRVHCVQSLVEFFQVKPAFPGGITKDRGDVVPLSVRDAHLRRSGGFIMRTN
jgi:hypothetical protein